MFHSKLYPVLSFLFLIHLPVIVIATDQPKDSAAIVNYFQQALLQPDKRDSFALLAESIAESNNSNLKIQDTYFYNLSKFYFQTGRLDPAFDVANQGLDLYKLAPHTYSAAKFHNLLGSVYSMQKDYENGIKQYQYAIKILELSGDSHTVALIQNNIANTFFSLTDYESAYKYSSRAYQTLKAENDTVNLPSLTGITAISAIKTGSLSEGRLLTSECLYLAAKYKNRVAEIIGYNCQGELYIIENRFDSAAISFSKSLELSQQYGQVHLAMLNKISLLTAYEKSENFKQAIRYGEEALTESAQMENQNTLYSIHKHLGYAYYGEGQYQKAFEHLNQAHDLYITSAGIQNKKIINDILIKYDTEKKEKELTLKELELTQNEIKLGKRKLWIIVLALCLVILVVVYTSYVRLQRQKFIRSKEIQAKKSLMASIEGEEKERARFASELHDGVASSITAIKMQLENYTKTESNSLNYLVNQLGQLHEETRRISHNLMPLSLSNHTLEQALENYCQENSTSNFKIHFANNSQSISEISKTDQLIIFRAIQELIQNVQRHASSTVCHVQISNGETHYIFSVEDEGIGFNTDQIKNNSGLKSLEKRIESIGGFMEFDTDNERGSLICIYLKK
jgi:signal transduction histidine kinase